MAAKIGYPVIIKAAGVGNGHEGFDVLNLHAIT
jgi:biotin carboxylase